MRHARILTDLFWSAVRAAAPRPAVEDALAEVQPESDGAVWLVALGKAANEMAAGAAAVMKRSAVHPAGGLVIAPRESPSPHKSFQVVAGDHPVPGARSLAASAALELMLARVSPRDEVWVLLSGGATSLAAAPVGSLSQNDLAELFRILLASGMDIHEMNSIRKRFLRWGAGRLALGVEGARVLNLVMSDVVGDDLRTIGCGPCVPDPGTAGAIMTLLEARELWTRIPPAVQRRLVAEHDDPTLETPKPVHPAFTRVQCRVIAGNRHALHAAAERARKAGLEAHVVDAPLTGDAAAAGRLVAARLISALSPSSATPRCLMWGGETTVTIDPCTAPPGGRCQELALACAGELHAAGVGSAIALLAAGTDGRDGDTDAAGAIVDGTTWERVRRAGRDPRRDLDTHHSNAALDAASALLRTDLTGTNVMDVVIGLCDSRRAALQVALARPGGVTSLPPIPE